MRYRKFEWLLGRAKRTLCWVGLVSCVAALPSDRGDSGLAIAATSGFRGVFTYHNDNARTGANLAETILTSTNVNSSKFGKLFSYAVDGEIYAQPLYARNVSIPHQGKHNVVYVVTEHDSVYAFDADGKQSAPLWTHSFLNPAAGITSVPAGDTGSDDLTPEIGVTSTPVIDPVSGIIYVESVTKQSSGGNSTYSHQLHALSLSSGAEKFGGPREITASMNATGDGSSGGTLAFDSLHQRQRAALLLSKGIIYVAFASYSDNNPYHAWVIAYNAHTLRQVGFFNGTPDGSRGGIWQTGNGPASDLTGAVFVGTGNGTFDANSGGRDYGDSLLKLTRKGSSVSLADYFTPANQQALNDSDADFATGGPLLLPDQSVGSKHLALIPDKGGTLYLVNRDNLGHFNAAGDTQIVQEFQVSGGMFSSLAYFNGRIYVGPVSSLLASYPLSGGQINTSGRVTASASFGFPGVTPAISANGTKNGIVWVIDTGNAESGSAVLYAFDATTMAKLYDSTQAGSRDTAGIAVKFATPTIAAGRVYVGTQAELDVYGLLP